MTKIDWPSMTWVSVDFEDEGWVQLSDGTWIEPWSAFSDEHRAMATSWAWDRWVIASCVERNSGHAWWLDWDEEEGLWLHCEHCPAGVDELYPDGQDLICGELPIPGMPKPLVIDCGMPRLDSLATRWSGPVRARVEEVFHRGGPWGGPEWDAWVAVEAA